MNRDITYCNGKNCGLKNGCRRFTDGQIILSRIHRQDEQGDDDDSQYIWMDNCDPEIREGYMPTPEKTARAAMREGGG